MNALRAWARSQWLLRSVVAVTPLLALLASLPTGVEPWPEFFVLVLALSVGSAVVTDSTMGLTAMLLVVFWWGSRVSTPGSPWVLVAAALLLADQVASVLADYGPPTLTLDRALLRLWLRRATLVFLAAPVAWLVARVVDRAPEQPGIWVAGLVACVGAAVAAIVTLRLAEPER